MAESNLKKPAPYLKPLVPSNLTLIATHEHITSWRLAMTRGGRTGPMWVLTPNPPAPATPTTPPSTGNTGPPIKAREVLILSGVEAKTVFKGVAGFLDFKGHVATVASVIPQPIPHYASVAILPAR